MNNEQRDNLIKLADYLEGGELLADFDMWSYDGYKAFTECDNCGTVGCAIGHGPYAGISKDHNECWEEYSERVFGLVPESKEWCYCFRSAWKNYDNTPKGAATRIRNLLAGEKIKYPWVDDYE